jgi:hypothetical protein
MEIKLIEIKDGLKCYEIRFKYYKKFFCSTNIELTESIFHRMDKALIIDWSYLPIYFYKKLFNKKAKQVTKSIEDNISVEKMLRNKGFVQVGDIYENGFTCIDLKNNNIWHKGISKVKTKFELYDIDIYINNFVWR